MKYSGELMKRLRDNHPNLIQRVGKVEGWGGGGTQTLGQSITWIDRPLSFQVDAVTRINKIETEKWDVDWSFNGDICLLSIEDGTYRCCTAPAWRVACPTRRAESAMPSSLALPYDRCCQSVLKYISLRIKTLMRDLTSSLENYHVNCTFKGVFVTAWCLTKAKGAENHWNKV